MTRTDLRLINLIMHTIQKAKTEDLNQKFLYASYKDSSVKITVETIKGDVELRGNNFTGVLFEDV